MEWTKGPWTSQEDKLLIQYVTQNGEGRWSSVSKCTGLKRSGKSSRLRWVNYLRPGLKKGRLTPQEEGILIELHALWGNKWSTIARYLPGRTDNEIKNYWRTHFNTRKPSHVKQEKSRKQESETGDGNDGSESSQEMVLASIDDHQFWPTVHQESAASDFVPMDCYLWGGLWNLDDSDDLCSKMGVDQNRNDVANCSHLFQGDGGDYTQSKELLL